MIHPVPFYILTALTTAGALGVLLARNPVYAVLSLVAALFGLSAFFVALGAHFLAFIQILVYAGAVLVLFLFVVMLLDMAPERLSRVPGRTLRFTGLAAGLLLLATLVRELPRHFQASGGPALTGTPAEIGRRLLTTYALPFEAASILLLVGVIGAIVLAKRKPDA